jgi:hypothetical protein
MGPPPVGLDQGAARSSRSRRDVRVGEIGVKGGAVKTKLSPWQKKDLFGRPLGAGSRCEEGTLVPENFGFE